MNKIIKAFIVYCCIINPQIFTDNIPCKEIFIKELPIIAEALGWC